MSFGQAMARAGFGPGFFTEGPVKRVRDLTSAIGRHAAKTIAVAVVAAPLAAAPGTARADGITPTPINEVTRYDPGVIPPPDATPCTRRVKLTYKRNGAGSDIDEWYFLIEPCQTDHGDYPSATGPRAILILFTGGSGFAGVAAGEPSSTNFVVRQRYAFAAAVPAIVAVIDAASDFQSNSPGKACSTGSGLRGCRFSEDHMIDVANVIQDLRATARFPANLPVWLVGTSRGAISAVAAADLLDPAYGPDGLVLSSPVINDRQPNEDVLDADLGSITVPVEIVSHRSDECVASDPDGRRDNPDGLDALIDGLTGASRLQTKFFNGGYPAVGDTCGSLSPHGFFGVEEEVTKKIADFIVGLSE